MTKRPGRNGDFFSSLLGLLLMMAGVALFSWSQSGCGNLPGTLPDNQAGASSGQPAPDADGRGLAQPGVETGSGAVTNDAPDGFMAADFDGDGAITDQDLQLFSDAFGAAEGDSKFDPIFDLDGDSRITLVDMQIFVTLAEQQEAWPT